MFKMVDKGQPDYKILAVPATDPNFDDYKDLSDIPRHFPTEVGQVFMTYKQLEGLEIVAQGWVGAEVAKQQILHAIPSFCICRRRPGTLSKRRWAR